MKNQGGIVFRDVFSLLSKIRKEDLERIVLVGGQALIFWADYYDIDEEEAGIPLMSKDIDFLGGQEIAEHCAMLIVSTPGNEYNNWSTTNKTFNTAKLISAIKSVAIEQCAICQALHERT
jgi:hypothetical protein